MCTTFVQLNFLSAIRGIVLPNCCYGHKFLHCVMTKQTLDRVACHRWQKLSLKKGWGCFIKKKYLNMRYEDKWV